jgi:hypothetical protein
VKTKFAIAPHELDMFRAGAKVGLADPSNMYPFYIICDLDDVVIEQGRGWPTVALKKPHR